MGGFPSYTIPDQLLHTISMGNQTSKPARKLAKSVQAAPAVHRTAQAQMPKTMIPLNDSRTHAQAQVPTSQNPAQEVPQGKDGGDPQVSQAFVDSITQLGRQILSNSAKPPSDQLNVRALKQLLNRKLLYERGQQEVDSQVNNEGVKRTMIHPRTLSAVLSAVHENGANLTSVMEDYQLDKSFLQDLGRFQPASTVVVIEDARKEDEIGPKPDQPVPVVASEKAMNDYEGEMAEEVNSERLRELKRRLE